MRFKRENITLSCPTCDEPFYVNVDPPDRSVGIMGATIVEVWTEIPMPPVCVHVRTWFDYTVDSLQSQTLFSSDREIRRFEDALYEQLEDEARDRYEDEQEAKYERWKERDL